MILSQRPSLVLLRLQIQNELYMSQHDAKASGVMALIHKLFLLLSQNNAGVLAHQPLTPRSVHRASMT